MRTTRLCGALVAAAALLLAAGGCGAGLAPLAPVRGKVSYRGQFLQSGMIVFTPDADRGSRGDLAWAEIQRDGSYVLQTGDAAGAAAGWHRVTVSAILPPTAAPLPGQPYAIPLSLLPQKYRDPQLSGLGCEVKADKPNTIDFQLD